MTTTATLAVRTLSAWNCDEPFDGMTTRDEHCEACHPLPVVLVLGRDEVGLVAESEGWWYYITECCGASAKGSDGIVCRACYYLIDERLGGCPEGDLIEVFGDGIPHARFVAQFIGTPRSEVKA